MKGSSGGGDVMKRRRAVCVLYSPSLRGASEAEWHSPGETGYQEFTVCSTKSKRAGKVPARETLLVWLAGFFASTLLFAVI
jgi:hypothetical protein